MKREFTVVVQRESVGWYVASVPELRGCHTQARSLDDLMERTREAIVLCLGDDESESGDFVAIQRVGVEI